MTVDLDASKQSEARVRQTLTVETSAGNAVGGVTMAVSLVAAGSPTARGRRPLGRVFHKLAGDDPR